MDSHGFLDFSSKKLFLYMSSRVKRPIGPQDEFGDRDK